MTIRRKLARPDSKPPVSPPRRVSLSVTLTSTGPERVDRIPYETAVGSGLIEEEGGGGEVVVPPDLPGGLFFQDPENPNNFNQANIDFDGLTGIVPGKKLFAVCRWNGDLEDKTIAWGSVWVTHPDHLPPSTTLFTTYGENSRYLGVWNSQQRLSAFTVKAGTLTVTATVDGIPYDATYTVLPES